MLGARQNHVDDAVELRGGNDDSADGRKLKRTVHVPRQRGEEVAGALLVTKDSIGIVKTTSGVECRISYQRCGGRAKVRTVRKLGDRSLPSR